ncbi:MAG: cytochrome d ubiquinol oxidase subunit II [Mailhella sp.]|nr:cytochrome d ubiquinol oxidase subunit II [Mailhella sp.]
METIWFCLWILLWAVYFALDGFDLGMGTLMPFLARNATERRIIVNAQGPYWDGNEVWLLTAGGATFAAFPAAYGTMFSALYAPLLLLLFCLIFRGCAFEFRGKASCPGWAAAWDACLFAGSFLPALLLGVAFANLFMGIPVDGDGIYHGNLLMLLNPYGLAGGVLFVLMFCYHGAVMLDIKTEGVLQSRARSAAYAVWPLLAGMLAVFLIATAQFTGTFGRVAAHPVLYAALTLAAIGLAGSRLALGRSALGSWTGSAVFIMGLTFFGAGGMYPNLIISSIDPAFSLTVHNAASSPLTLKIMLAVALCAVPCVLGYQAWVYRLFSGKVTEKSIEKGHSY